MLALVSQRRSLLSALFFTCLISGLTLVSGLFQPRVAAAFDGFWVQNHTETPLWSGPDAQAVSFGLAPQWSYFRVVSPQQGERLQVVDARNGGLAYIDAPAVGPSSPPPALASPPSSSAPASGTLLGNPAQPLRQMPSLPEGFPPSWVANFEETVMWAGAEKGAPSLGPVPQFRRFLVMEPQSGGRLRVWNPEKDSFGYLDAEVLGPSGPSVWVDPLQAKVVKPVGLPARSLGNKSYVRAIPVSGDESEARHVLHNSPLQLQDLVETKDGAQWYRLADGGFIAATEVRVPRPVETHLPGRWIDADLEVPVMLTAYEGDRPVYTGLAVKGVTAFSTPKGTFSIGRRVENETMDSETLFPPIPRDGPGGYLLKNVLYTQYFATDGSSIHYNYWLVTFGYPGSHGCLGMNLDDSKFFWDWAGIGTPIVIR